MTIRPSLVLLFAVLLSGCSTTPTATKKPVVLSQQQAHFLAEKLASAKYGWAIGETGIRHSSPPRLNAGEWFWRWRRGSGQGDMEITVTFAPDGSSPVVDYEYYTGEVYIRR